MADWITARIDAYPGLAEAISAAAGDNKSAWLISAIVAALPDYELPDRRPSKPKGGLRAGSGRLSAANLAATHAALAKRADIGPAELAEQLGVSIEIADRLLVKIQQPIGP
jgi:hypothetical protein